MAAKESDIPIKVKGRPRKLEDCKPGATRDEVLRFMEKVVTSPKPCQKRAESPAPASK